MNKRMILYLEGGILLIEAAMAAIGIALTVLALLIFRRREMERSGDVIAVKPLRPVFLYCFSFGSAIVLSYIVSSLQSTFEYTPYKS